MEEPFLLTVFTDPMMGLSYESEPIIDALCRRYREKLRIRYVIQHRDMSLFLQSFDLNDFVKAIDYFGLS